MNRLAILMTAVLLAGCSRPYADENTPILPQGELVGTTGSSTRIYVFIDEEAHNICYITEGNTMGNSVGAISCVPLAYSNLHQENSNVVYR